MEKVQYFNSKVDKKVNNYALIIEVNLRTP